MSPDDEFIAVYDFPYLNFADPNPDADEATLAGWVQRALGPSAAPTYNSAELMQLREELNREP